MKLISLLVFVCATCVRLCADQPIHVVNLKTCPEFELLPGHSQIYVYPLSERMKRVTKDGSRPRLAAADYSVGVALKTAKPNLALQAIVRQIWEQTGRKLGKFVNSTVEQMKPATMLMAVDGNSVWCLVLTPKTDQPDTYLLSCGFVIDEEPAALPANAPK
ncbi:MAG: hypothetical protein KF715_12805 [Candidatus Didemnitutus sp.]|nr:hypothetical protein [Candidatus Didemnitutus sp.]